MSDRSEYDQLTCPFCHELAHPDPCLGEMDASTMDKMEITELLTDVWWVADHQDDGRRKLALQVRTAGHGDVFLVMSEPVAQHLSDLIWHGKL